MSGKHSAGTEPPMQPAATVSTPSQDIYIYIGSPQHMVDIEQDVQERLDHYTERYRRHTMAEHSVKIRLDYNMSWEQLQQEIQEAGVPAHARVSVYKYNAGNDPRESSYAELTFTWGNTTKTRSANTDRTIVL